jgi:hypothetical protein
VRKIVVLFFSCHFCFCCFSQTAKQSFISPYIKTGAYSHKQADVFSFGTNQASLVTARSFSAGVFSERKFMLSDLNLFSAAFALPTTSGNFGLQVHRFGNSAYNETQAGIAYARKLSDYIDVGVQFNYYTMRIAGYGNAAAINFEAGAIFHFTDNLHGGVHVYNPTAGTIGKNEKERLPAVYSAGLGYDASESFFINAEIEKTENLPLSVNASIQYKFSERFLARGGMVSSTSVYFFGAGFILHNIRIDATASVHPQLGVTPGVLLIYTKPKKQ